jgi:hypothetical protein
VSESELASSDPSYDLTCWYINFRRAFELLASAGLSHRLKARYVSGLDEHFQRLQVAATIKDVLVDWFQAAQPPTLGKLLLNDSLKPGVVFTHLSDFYGKGLPELRRGNVQGMAEIYCRLESFQSGATLRVPFDPVHLLSNSAWDQLSGHNRLLVLAAVDQADKTVIRAIPYVVASILDPIGKTASMITRWTNYGEMYVGSIDNFERIEEENDVRVIKQDLELLKSVPEAAIKAAFAEILGEPDVPKDWAGERSDLLSTQTRVDGRRLTTAFLFKGPAKFRPMHMASLGKNGDQIDRLFGEPADLLVLQHCHTVERDLRGAMRAYANQIGRPRLFAIVDGYDTLRLLRAYSKCGFAPSGRRPGHRAHPPDNEPGSEPIVLTD